MYNNITSERRLRKKKLNVLGHDCLTNRNVYGRLKNQDVV